MFGGNYDSQKNHDCEIFNELDSLFFLGELLERSDPTCEVSEKFAPGLGLMLQLMSSRIQAMLEANNNHENERWKQEQENTLESFFPGDEGEIVRAFLKIEREKALGRLQKELYEDLWGRIRYIAQKIEG